MVRLALTLGAVALPLALAQQPQPPFRGASEVVRVFVTVTGRDGQLVTTLTKDQFEVRDDGKPQPIVVFDNSPRPIQLVVMLDVSGSMAGNLTLLQSASRELFAGLGAGDVARVGTFGREIVISPEFTRDVDALQAAVPDHISENAPTPLWRGLDEAMSAFDPTSDRRRVVLVLSDGKDADVGFGRRIVSQVDVIDRARADDVMVYGIGLRSRSAAPNLGIGPGGLTAALTADLPDPGLARTAEETGGGYAEIRPRDNLGEAFAQIARELHSQYLLGYEPPKRDGKTHKIEVRVSASGQGLTPRARRTYLAPRAPRTIFTINAAAPVF
jgi:Ca-activated chloride channel family protein